MADDASGPELPLQPVTPEAEREDEGVLAHLVWRNLEAIEDALTRPVTPRPLEA